MSYVFDIDNVTTLELQEEIQRRELALQQQKCPYCKVKLQEHTCRFRNNLSWFHRMYTDRLEVKLPRG